MNTGLVAAPLLLAAIFGTWGGLLWWHEHHWQRFTAWLLALAAWFVTLAVPAWQYALAALLKTSGGATAIIVLVLIAGATFYLTAVRTDRKSWLRRTLLGKKEKGSRGPGKDLVPYIAAESPRRPARHHRVWTPLWSIVTGTLGVVVFGGWRLLAEDIGRSAANSARDLIQSSKQINSGQAATAVPPNHRAGIYIAGVIVLLVITVILRGIENHRHPKEDSKAGKGGRGGPQMIGGGM